MNSRKKKSIHQLADGILQFEDKRKSIPQADFTDLQTFLSAYLNTPEPKKRKKLAEEFRKRHMELYEFLQSNPELIRAETKITATLQAAASGAAEEDDNGQITNLFEKLRRDWHGTTNLFPPSRYKPCSGGQCRNSGSMMLSSVTALSVPARPWQ